MAIGYSSEKGNPVVGLIFRVVHTSFLQLVATTYVLLELMILCTLETIFWIEREERKKEGMLIRKFWHFLTKMLFCHTSKALVVTFDAEPQENWNRSIHPSSIHPSIHPNWCVRGHCWFTGGQFHHNHIWNAPWSGTRRRKVLYNTYKTVSSWRIPSLSTTTHQGNKGCVTLCGLPFTLTKDLKAKEELWKLKYFTMQKYTNLQKLL